jgi:hypothetical protein
MTFLSRLFGKKSRRAPPAPSLSELLRQNAAQESGSKSGRRRELLRVALRDTLQRHGIPAGWVSADVLVSSSRSGERGIHWRLVLKHWEPRLLTHAVALQHSLVKRVTTSDPMASSWLTGISWQLAVADESLCPAMPSPRFWATRPDADGAAATPDLLAGGSADVISGPGNIDAEVSRFEEPLAGDAKAELAQLFAARDAHYHRHAQDALDPQATQPMFLGTEPAKL